jgi:hypothetical protein
MSSPQVVHEEHVGRRGPELGDEADRVESGAAGQLTLLDQDHVGGAGIGQVVGNAAAGDAATDDDDPGPLLHAYGTALGAIM